MPRGLARTPALRRTALLAARTAALGGGAGGAGGAFCGLLWGTFAVLLRGGWDTFGWCVLAFAAAGAAAGALAGGFGALVLGAEDETRPPAGADWGLTDGQEVHPGGLHKAGHPRFPATRRGRAGSPWPDRPPLPEPGRHHHGDNGAAAQA